MRRSGFTMIELIFVIVILGILASVAIPKLAATRDDAKISKAASEISTMVSDIGAYYTGHGVFDGDVSKMTNVKLNKKDSATLAAINDINATGVFYNDQATNVSCLKFVVSATDGNLTVSKENTTSTFCKGIDNAVADLIKKHQFGGSSISFN